MDRFDFVVIGAGPGGYVAAIRAAQLGLRTALIEKEQALGGTCLNVGCIPSKALLESSEHYRRVQHEFAHHGIVCGDVRLDLATLMARKQAVVKQLTDGVALLMKKHKIAVFRGEGRLVAQPGGTQLSGGSASVADAASAHGPSWGTAGSTPGWWAHPTLCAAPRGTPGIQVVVRGSEGEQTIEAGAVCLAMGSVPVELPFLRFDGRFIVTSTEALSFDAVPHRLLVVGAGAVGLELGSVWHRLGAEVTVVEMLPRIAPFADAQVSQVLERSLKAQGLDIRTETRVTGASVEGGEVRVQLAGPKGEETFSCDRVLVAVGRRPFTSSAGIREAGVALDAQGRVAIDENFRTTVAGVYAIGDLVRGPMLAHKAEEEGVAVAEIVATGKGHTDYSLIPNVVYTEPELAAVGLTEEQAKAEGIPYKLGRTLVRANGRAKSMGAEEGQVKIVAHAETGRILGVHMVGPHASELIAEATMALRWGATADDVGRTPHAHPTLAEILKEAALAVEKRSING